MREITTKLFTFEELSDEAKQKAIEQYRDRGYEPAWTEENRQTLEAFENVFPIKVSNWSYGGRGEGVTFSIISDHIEEVSGQRLATYLWNNYGRDLFKGRYYSTPMRSCPVDKEHPAGLTYKKRYSKIMLDNSCVLTGYCLDDDILKPIYDFLNKPTKGITFSDLMEDCFDAWIKACNNDIEYQNSDEYITEHFHANEYEFEEDGTIH